MFGNAKFRWFLLILFLFSIFCSGCTGLNNKTSKKLIASQERVRLYPKECLGYIGLGNAYSELNQFQKAIVSYKEAIRLNLCSNKDYTYLLIGDSHNELGQLKLAIEAYKEAIINNPNYAEAHFNLGQMYKKLPNSEEAVIAFKKAIDIEPNNPETHLALGNVYQTLNRYDEAIVSYAEVYKLDSKYNWIQSVINHLKLRSAQIKPLPLIKEQPQASKHKKEPPPLLTQIPKFQSKQLPKAIQSVYLGTGFLFSSRDYIITNWHVVKGAGSIEVKFPGGEVIKAKVLAKDSQNDIAVLKLSQSPSTQIPDLNFGDSSKVRPGDKVFTIGYPASSILGKNQKITDGIVSSITGIEDDPTMFQITVPIQPGNSGGPLFNESGEVIGITTASLSLNAIRSFGAVPQNVNYAIKSSFVNNLLTTIPKTLLSNRGIVVVPSKPGNSLADFFERVSNNIVLIEAKE